MKTTQELMQRAKAAAPALAAADTERKNRALLACIFFLNDLAVGLGKAVRQLKAHTCRF